MKRTKVSTHLSHRTCSFLLGVGEQVGVCRQVGGCNVRITDEHFILGYQKRRTLIAMEILTTERTYVKNLTILVKVFSSFHHCYAFFPQFLSHCTHNLDTNFGFNQRFLNPLTSAAQSHKPIIKPDQVKTVSTI